MPTAYAAIKGRRIVDVDSDPNLLGFDGEKVRKVHFCMPNTFDAAKADTSVTPRLCWAVQSGRWIDPNSIGRTRAHAIYHSLDGCYDDWRTVRREHGAKAVRVMVYRRARRSPLQTGDSR